MIIKFVDKVIPVCLWESCLHACCWQCDTKWLKNVPVILSSNWQHNDTHFVTPKFFSRLINLTDIFYRVFTKKSPMRFKFLSSEVNESSKNIFFSGWAPEVLGFRGGDPQTNEGFGKLSSHIDYYLILNPGLLHAQFSLNINS